MARPPPKILRIGDWLVNPLSSELSRGDERTDYWQAGKSVASIESEVPAGEIVSAFAAEALCPS